MSKRNPVVVVQLAPCLHWTKWHLVAAVNQEMRTCGTCKEIAQPLRWHTHEWQQTCLHCSWSVWLGSSIINVDETDGTLLSMQPPHARPHSHPSTLRFVPVDDELRESAREFRHASLTPNDNAPSLFDDTLTTAEAPPF